MASSNIHVFLTIFLLSSSLLFCPTTAIHLVQQECMHAPKLFQILKPARCMQLLSTDSKAFKATTLKDLAVISLQLGMSSATKALNQINAASGSAELKSVLKVVASQVTLVYDSFRSALAEVKAKEFETANYDCFVVSDYITSARNALKKAKGNVNMYQKSIDILADFGLINYVITNDADV